MLDKKIYQTTYWARLKQLVMKLDAVVLRLLFFIVQKIISNGNNKNGFKAFG